MQRAGTGRAGGGLLRSASHHQSRPGIQTECKHTWVSAETVLGCSPTEERVASVNPRGRAPAWTMRHHPWMSDVIQLSPGLSLAHLWSPHSYSPRNVYCGCERIIAVEKRSSSAATCWGFVPPLPPILSERGSDLSKLIREGIYWSPRWEWWINNETKRKIKSVIGDN